MKIEPSKLPHRESNPWPSSCKVSALPLRHRGPWLCVFTLISSRNSDKNSLPPCHMILFFIFFHLLYIVVFVFCIVLLFWKKTPKKTNDDVMDQNEIFFKLNEITGTRGNIHNAKTHSSGWTNNLFCHWEVNAWNGPSRNSFQNKIDSHWKNLPTLNSSEHNPTNSCLHSQH